ncbi:MAG: NBR1-Ig-like domain-containing protein, partial [Verrucomicrobiota bacterium]
MKTYSPSPVRGNTVLKQARVWWRTNVSFSWILLMITLAASSAQSTNAADGATLVSQTIPDGTVMSPGQIFTKTWTLRNTGTTTWTTGANGYTLNFAAGSDRMGAADTYLTLANPVAPNGQATFSVQLTAPAAPGTYTGNWRMNSAASVDFGPTVSVKIVVSANKPDLTKSSDNISRTAGSPGDTFTMTLRVKNQGNAASAATKVNFYLHKDSEDFSDASKVGEVNLGGLAAGATSAELRFDYVFPNNKPAGNYFFAYWIDAPGLVAESDENNNKWWWANIPITSTDGATLVSQTIPDGTVMSPGQIFTKTWTLRNTGTTTWTSGANGYTLNFAAGSDRMGAADTYLTLANPVAPNGQATFSVQLTAPAAPGTYTGNWRMNSAASVDFGPTVSVKIVVSANKPDLTRESDNISRTSGAPGDTFTITHRVRNGGTGPAAATKVYYYVNKDARST